MTEPVPGIRPTPNQGRESWERVGEGEVGALGITEQAGGAACLSDSDIEMNRSKIRRGGGGFRWWHDCRAKQRV